MSGILNALVAPQINYVVVGVNGTFPTRVGWGTAGSAGLARGSFVGSTNVSGQTLIEVSSDTSFDLLVAVSGAQLQTLFTRVTLVDGAGVGRTYTSASAITFIGTAPAIWGWGDGTSKVYVSGDTGEYKAIQFA